MIDIAFLETLVPAADAVDVLTKAYEQRGGTGDINDCRARSIETLAKRLQDGTLQAWASRCEITSTRWTGGVSENEIVSKSDEFSSSSIDRVPDEFWRHFQTAHHYERSFDPVTGDFDFRYKDYDYSLRCGVAAFVHFDPSGLPFIADIERPPRKGALKPEATSRPTNNAGGRKPANWWPDVAEELAVIVHSEGIPDTQEALIARLQEAVTARGRDEPSRAQLQPVVRAVFQRLREAGN